MLCLVALPPMARAGRRRPSTSVRRRGRTLAALPCRCGRRHVIGASSAAALLPFLAPPSPAAPPIDPDVMLQRVHPSRPDWYEEFYASAMDQGMKSYEAEVCKASLPALRRLGLAVGSITGFSADYTLQIAGYKAKLFSQLSPAGKSILELGVGTGPNFKYYASEDGVNVIGVDPNKHMENYARTAAVSAGLPSSSFTFRRGVAEALPAEDNSMDAVIGTLVLCSVNNMDMALREIKRVLKPDGLYVFIEHVAAPDGTLLQFVQGTLDPLQQFVADGCHLTRKTGQSIRDVGFSSLSLDSVRLSNAYIISPHVYGVACK